MADKDSWEGDFSGARTHIFLVKTGKNYFWFYNLIYGCLDLLL